MKRKIFLIVIFVLLIVYLQFGRPATVTHSTTSRDSSGYTMTLSVTMNQLKIISKEVITTNLIQHIADNSFKNIMFSYDELGYPNKLTVTVYTNRFMEFLNLPAFKFHYAQETPSEYDIVTSPENFSVIYE